MTNSIDPDGFRRLLGHFATGVTVVTATDGSAHPVGMTVSSVASVSLDPPLLLVCLDHAADAHDPLVAAPRFAVNILTAAQEPLSRRFAETRPDRFDGVRSRRSDQGVPLLEGALAWIECERHAVHPGGDHSILIGRVTGGSAHDGTPLVHFRGGYAGLDPR